MDEIIFLSRNTDDVTIHNVEVDGNKVGLIVPQKDWLRVIKPNAGLRNSKAAGLIFVSLIGKLGGVRDFIYSLTEAI